MDTESITDADSPQTQAVTWLVRLTSGEAAPQMLAEFDAWRYADHQHEQALADARHMWLELGKPLQLQYAPRLASLPRQRGGAIQRARQRWRPVMAAAAATLAFAIGLGQQWWTNWQYDQVTAVGEQRTLALHDGSTMWLNTGSAANIDVNPQRRHVRLIRGEAFFDVRHDPRHPFTIDAGAGQVKVLGTAFGVHREGDDILVTVQRGKVQVSGGGTAPVVITPDQRVRVRIGDAIKRIEFVNSDQDLSWRNGRLVFEDRPLSEILTELKRYDNRVLIVRYPEANRIRMNAMIDLARLDEWYDGLEQSLPVEVTRFGPAVLVRAAEHNKSADAHEPVEAHNAS